MEFIEKINKLKTQREKIQKKIDNRKNRSVDIDNKLAKSNYEKEKSIEEKFLVEAELKTLKAQFQSPLKPIRGLFYNYYFAWM